jgi:hypothetical protein
MASTFGDYLCDDVDVLYFLWCMLCDVSFTISYSHGLSKIFRYCFLVTTRMVKSLSLVLQGMGLRGKLCEQLLDN